MWSDAISNWREAEENLDEFDINTARLVVKSLASDDVEFWWQTSDCKGVSGLCRNIPSIYMYMYV